MTPTFSDENTALPIYVRPLKNYYIIHAQSFGKKSATVCHNQLCAGLQRASMGEYIRIYIAELTGFSVYIFLQFLSRSLSLSHYLETGLPSSSQAFPFLYIYIYITYTRDMYHEVNARSARVKAADVFLLGVEDIYKSISV